MLAGRQLLRFAIGLVEEVLLLLGQIVQVAHELLALLRRRIVLLRIRLGAQVLQHLLELRQHLARRVAGTAARHLAGLVEHALERVAVQRHLLVLGIAALLGIADSSAPAAISWSRNWFIACCS